MSESDHWNFFDDTIRKSVDNAFKTIKSCMDDAILTAIDNVVIPRVKIAVRSITGSSRHGPNNTIQNPERRNFTGIRENTLLMSTFNRLDLNIDQDRIDVTRDSENFEDDDFPRSRPNYDRQAQAHHMVRGHTAPQNTIPEFLTRRVTQNNPLPQHFTPPQNMPTYNSHENTLPMVEQTPRKQVSDSGNPVNRFVEVIAYIAS